MAIVAPAHMKTSQNGVNKIKSREGLVLHAYPDPATGGAPWTIGVGHTGQEVYPGMVITADEADEILRRDLARFERGVSDAVKVPLTQSQFDALVSFAFNVGLANFRSSTLLKKLNAGDKIGAADQFLRWDRAAGKRMQGLANRRASERALFLTGSKIL